MKTFVLSLLSIIIFTEAQQLVSESIRIQDIKSLTLYKGQVTTSRRTQPIPQLKCIGGTAYKDPYPGPDVVQCFNKGTDGLTINWQCQASMDSRFKLGKLNVQCEGYTNFADENVLRDSCSLEYELDYV